MKKFLQNFLFVLTLSITYTTYGQQAPSIQWQKCLGGGGDDEARSIQQTIEGGFIVVGHTNSNDGDVSGNHSGYGFNDCWVVKLDAVGNLLWQKCLGGSYLDYGYSIHQTTDAGFIIAGATSSNDGDVSGWHEAYDNGNGLCDYWVVKLDSDGNLLWQKCLGGFDDDFAMSAQQTADGGFIVAGYSRSNDGDVTGHHGFSHIYDYWIVKLDASGNLEWEKSLGGDDEDYGRSIQQTYDGGFIVAGTSRSDDGDVSGNHWGNWSTSDDFWVVKLDTAGTIVWQKSLGGSDADNAYSVAQTSDSGFIVAGFALSNDSDVSGNHLDSSNNTSEDNWIVKLDVDGNLLWQKCLGGSDRENASAIQQTTDGGFVIAASANSYDGDVSGNHGGNFWGDSWIVKLDSVGNLIWQECLGGSNDERAHSIQQTTDGGFIVAGYSRSNDGDVSGSHGGWSDYWIVKLSPEIPTAIPSPPTNSISLHPNPVQNLLTIDLATQAADATICVYDVQGRKIFLPTTFSNSTAQLSTSTLPDGIYMLQLINNKTGDRSSAKFVKED